MLPPNSFQHRCLDVLVLTADDFALRAVAPAILPSFLKSPSDAAITNVRLELPFTPTPVG